MSVGLMSLGLMSVGLLSVGLMKQYPINTCNYNSTFANNNNTITWTKLLAEGKYWVVNNAITIIILIILISYLHS